MRNMLNKYMTLVENNMLNTVSATEMKLVAIQVKIKIITALEKQEPLSLQEAPG